MHSSSPYGALYSRARPVSSIQLLCVQHVSQLRLPVARHGAGGFHVDVIELDAIGWREEAVAIGGNIDEANCAWRAGHGRGREKREELVCQEPVRDVVCLLAVRVSGVSESVENRPETALRNRLQ